MQISAFIFDWDCQAQLSVGLWNLNAGQGDSDSFTLHNDSVTFSQDFASLFLRAKSDLPPKSAEVIERFLVNCCPGLMDENILRPDYDLTVHLEWVYSTLAPSAVRARLASLLNIDFSRLLPPACPGGLRRLDTGENSVIRDSTEIYAFLFICGLRPTVKRQAKIGDWAFLLVESLSACWSVQARTMVHDSSELAIRHRMAGVSDTAPRRKSSIDVLSPRLKNAIGHFIRGSNARSERSHT